MNTVELLIIKSKGATYIDNEWENRKWSIVPLHTITI